MKSPVCVLLALAWLAAPALAEGQDWPRWRGPLGDGVSTEQGWNAGALSAGARVLWSADIGAGYSNPVIRGGRLYTMGAGGDHGEKLTFTCRDPETGSVIWKRELALGVWQPQATPAVDGELLFGLSGNGKLLCLRTSDGSEVWRKDLRADFGAVKPTGGWSASPVLDGGLLFLNANTLQLALDPGSGELRWKAEETMKRGSWGSFATPLLFDGGGRRRVAFLGPTELRVFTADTGEKLWSWTHGDGMHPVPDPLLGPWGIFLCLTDRCALLDAAGGGLRWKSEDLSSCMASPVRAGPLVVGSHWNTDISTDSWEGFRHAVQSIRGLDGETGKVMWEKEAGAVSLTVVGDLLLLLDVDGVLRAVRASPSGLTEVSSADVLAGQRKPRTFATPPVPWHGRLYCRNFAGDLLCIDMR
jgi:outer membrane protein assembly factor BamB